MRADRLVAIVLLLQTRGQMTAGELAEQLETSERTIRRDLDALSGAGVPVYAQRGRGGGWALLGGHRIDLSGLTAEEAQALFLVAGPQAVAGLGVGPGVKSALRKLLAALPAPIRESAEAANAAIHVDATRWGRTDEPTAPRHLDALRRAVLAGIQVELVYAKPGQEPTRRRIHPYGLVSKAGVWYLLAGSDAGLRTFRVSRVRGVGLTDETVERPEDFDLAQAWEEVRTRVPGTFDGLTVHLWADEGSARMLTAALAGWGRIEAVPGEDRGGQQRYAATFPNPHAAAAELARFGHRVEVISPPEVRAELGRLGEELVGAYAAVPPGARPRKATSRS
jgi:predicted DNA-binding transcriptional regulator YafY